MWNGWNPAVCVAMLGSLCMARPDGDLCRWMNGRKYYIGVGETGAISVGNVTSSSSASGETANSTGPGDLGSPGQPRIPQRCSVELITCPSCHIVVSVLYLNIPSCSGDGSCQCDYVWVKEPTVGKSGQEFCGITSNLSSQSYQSKTKLLSIDFLYSFSYNDAFSLQFSAESNTYSHQGQVDYHKGGASGFIESPHFPVGYPSDYSAEHSLRNLDARGFVQLVFTDFQLSPWSYVEVLDSNGSRVDVYNGNTFRPPILASAGPSLVVRFRANDEYPNVGFRAKYTFVNYPEKYWFNKPSTDCGGMVEDLGGAITMMNMAAPGTTRNFDCIWLLRPSSSYTFETHISVRVAQFEEMGPESALEIRQGLTSVSYLLESMAGPQSHKAPQGQEYIISASIGFYIRLQGTFSNKSRLAIVYSTFSYETIECQNTGDFECGNGRCIKSILHCDGFNHCGDGSDESACYAVPGTNGRVNPKDGNWWHSLTPNYYFPKQESSAAAGTNTLILITSLAGLGMFVLTTVMILVKLHKQRRLEVVGRDALRTISADVDSETGSVGNGRHPFGPAEPPLYDPPPSYEDVIKFYMPPPPAYNAIVEHPRSAAPVCTNPNPTNSAPSGATRSSTSRDGVENAAYVPDERGSPRRPNQSSHGNRRHSSSSSSSSSPSSKATHLLKVILPPVNMFERGANRRHKSADTKRQQPQGSHCDSRAQSSRHRQGATPQSRQGLLASAGLVHALLDRYVPTTSAAQSGGEASSPRGRPRQRDPGPKLQPPPVSCQCQGACSCGTGAPTPARTTKVRRLLCSNPKYVHLNQSENRVTSSSSSSATGLRELSPENKVPLSTSSSASRHERRDENTKSEFRRDNDRLQAPPCTRVAPPCDARQAALGEGSPPEEIRNSEQQATEMTVTKDTQPLLRRTSSLPELAVAVVPTRSRAMTRPAEKVRDHMGSHSSAPKNNAVSPSSQLPTSSAP